MLIAFHLQTRNIDTLENQLTDMGLTAEEAEETIDKVRSRSRSRSVSRVGRKRERSASRSQNRPEEDHLSDKKKQVCNTFRFM